jgi:hypothetical protein
MVDGQRPGRKSTALVRFKKGKVGQFERKRARLAPRPIGLE